MGPHKDPAKLPVDDQLKLLRNSIDGIASDVSFQGMRLRSVESQVKIVRTEIKDVGKDVKDLNKKFDQQDKNFKKLYNMIDKFTGRIRKQDGEIAAIAFRKEEHETRISKLENKVFATT